MTISPIRERIFIGTKNDATSDFHLRHFGITATLNVAIDLSYLNENVLPVKVGLIDGPGNKPETLHLAELVLHNLLAYGHHVLVHCYAGISRSPTVVATYLARREGKTLEAVLQELKQLRDVVDPNPDMIALGQAVLAKPDIIRS